MGREAAYVRVGDRVESINGWTGEVVRVPEPRNPQMRAHIRAHGEGSAQRHYYVTVRWDNGRTGKINPAHGLTRESIRR